MVMAKHRVKTYFRRDGTKVQAHESTSPGTSGSGQNGVSADDVKKAAALAAAADNHSLSSEDYLGIPGALPPNRNSVGARKASEYASGERGDVIGPVRLEDGRHAIGVFEHGMPNPRTETDDLTVGIGEFAVMGDRQRSQRGRSRLTDEASAEHRFFQLGSPEDDIETALPAMLREMHGEPPNPELDGWPGETPTDDEMNEAALAFRKRTGDFAFPLYVDESDNTTDINLANPEESDPPPGEPAGFAFLSREQARVCTSDRSMGAAFDSMSYAAQIRNDWAAGTAVTGTVLSFDDDDTTEQPDNAFGIGFHTNDELGDVLCSEMSAY